MMSISAVSTLAQREFGLRGNRRAALAVALMALLTTVPAGAATTTYDSFDAPGGHTLADYQEKWANPFGLGEMSLSDTRGFAGDRFSISASPFRSGSDFSVFDHLKYIAISTQAFDVPASGTISFSSTIEVQTVGTQPGRIINGTYVQSGLPYAAAALEGQQAAAVMNVVDFATGQLFDWFISGSTAFTLIERLSSSVTNPSLQPGDPGYVGIDKMYTQIIDEVAIGPGAHEATISYNSAGVTFLLDGQVISRVGNVGIPLDQQGLPYTGIYPSYGPGELLGGQIQRFQIGHGLFSLIDAFPFQHPDRPDLSVTIPLANRIFGQGIDASFDNFRVTTSVPEPATWGLMIAGLGLAGAAARRHGDYRNRRNRATTSR